MSNETTKPFFTPKQRELIKKVYCLDQGLTDDQAEIFLAFCERSQLDPIAKQVYCRAQNVNKGTKEKPKWEKEMIIITSIEGYRSMAEGTGEYLGQTPPEWYYANDEGSSDWHSVCIIKRDQRGNTLTMPEACRVGILRKGFPQPVIGIANFASFAQYAKSDDDNRTGRILNLFWNRMPEHQIAKCAEAQGFRKTFPKIFSGVYIEEEIQPEPDMTTQTPLAEGATTPQPEPDNKSQPAQSQQQAPTPTPEPEKKAAKGRQKAEKKAGEGATPAPGDKTSASPASGAGTPPSGDNGESWKTHVIAFVAAPGIKGSKVGDLTAEQVDLCRRKWADPYAEKIAKDPARLTEAKAILAAHRHHFPKNA